MVERSENGLFQQRDRKIFGCLLRENPSGSTLQVSLSCAGNGAADNRYARLILLTTALLR